ncbi:hypothetical protein NJ7G_3235 [Natrinema sp. J7-2]|nr:hypothetical protein NJ7G_3235 [Natrinema sp. J7-2]
MAVPVLTDASDSPSVIVTPRRGAVAGSSAGDTGDTAVVRDVYVSVE